MRIRKNGLFLFLGAAAVVAGSTFSCSSSKTCLDEPDPDAACCAPLAVDRKTGACLAASGDAAQDGPSSDGPVEAPSDCNESADPKGEPKCVVNGFALFVSGAGNDTNAGTKEAPLKTIGAALGKSTRRIYVCEGTYAEHVKVSSGVTLVGGFACSDWTYTGMKAKVAPADAGFALELAKADGVLVSDLSFEAVAGTTANRSSIAAFAHGAKGRLLRVELVAHEGKDGASATAAASNYDAALLADDVKLAGHTASGTVGGLQQDCPGLCTNNDHSTGGKGGAGGAVAGSGDPGKPDRGAGVAGMANGGCIGVGAGGIGGPGGVGTAGEDAVAALTVGTLTEQGWSPSDGVAGKAGGPGQGGGGGGGKISGANGGGGGGGCGGSPGSVAEGGGASIALLSLTSTLTLTNATLTTAKAGAGGAGIAGQGGQVGGTGGIQTAGGCPGGEGGAGASGGASAGGAGGVSAGVVSKGGKPTLESPMTMTGKEGSKGTGGKPGTNDGKDGQKADTIELP